MLSSLSILSPFLLRLLLVGTIFCTSDILLIAQHTKTIEIYFSSGQYQLSSAEEQRLTDFQHSLDSVATLQLLVSGYCDDIGDDAYNDSLSKRRAEAVRLYLSSLGIANTYFLAVEGKGKILLSAQEKNKATVRAMNRKVEVKAYYTLKQKKDTLTPTVSVLSDHMQAGDRVVLENILFQGGYRTFLPESYAALDTLTAVMKRKSQYHILILGHICCMPPGEDGMDMETGLYNLSVMRAKAVYDYLIEKGIAPERLDYKGMKADYPTGKGAKYDRRVEVEITR